MPLPADQTLLENQDHSKMEKHPVSCALWAAELILKSESFSFPGQMHNATVCLDEEGEQGTRFRNGAMKALQISTEWHSGGGGFCSIRIAFCSDVEHMLCIQGWL